MMNLNLTKNLLGFGREFVVSFMTGTLILGLAWGATWAFTASNGDGNYVHNLCLLALGVAVTICAAFLVTLPTALCANPRRVRTAVVAGFGAVFVPLVASYFGVLSLQIGCVLLFWIAVIFGVAALSGRRRHFSPRSLRTALSLSPAQSRLLEARFRESAINSVYLVSLFVAAVLGVCGAGTGFALGGATVALTTSAAIVVYLLVLVMIWRSNLCRRDDTTTQENIPNSAEQTPNA